MKSLMPRQFVSAAIVGCLWGAGFGCAAHTGNSTAQQQEIAGLKRTMEEMNARLEHLEGQGTAATSAPNVPPAAPTRGAAIPSAVPTEAAAVPPAMPTQAVAVAPTPPAADSPAVLRQRWRTITYGMTFEQVAALLGPPQGSIEEDPKTIWYYSYPEVGSGSIVFVQEHGVTDWQTPPFGNWAFWP